MPAKLHIIDIPGPHFIVLQGYCCYAPVMMCREAAEIFRAYIERWHETETQDPTVLDQLEIAGAMQAWLLPLLDVSLGPVLKPEEMLALFLDSDEAMNLGIRRGAHA